MTVFHTNDAVRITYEGKTLDGVVLLASPNGRSLMLSFDGMLGGYAGMMPTFDGKDLIRRLPVVVTLIGRPS